MVFKFNSAKAVSYANNFALKNNSFYKRFDIGEDCNFVSQCLFAGSETFDKKNDGWFYDNENNFSLSWNNAEQLMKFLLSAKKGPFGRVVNDANLGVGDLVFDLQNGKNEVGIVTKVVGEEVFYAVKKDFFEEKSVQKMAPNGCKYLHILGVKK